MRPLRPFLAALLLGGASMLAPTAAGAATELPADVVTYLQESVAGGPLPGVVVALVEGDDVVIRGFGLANRETGKAVDETTIFEIGSITKTFTGTLLAQEVLAGRLKLDDPIQPALPAGTTIAQPGRPISYVDLSTHRSGLPRLPSDFKPADPTDPYADYDAARLWASLAALKPARAAGEGYEYSNLGVGLLGELLARKTGTSYRDLVGERILKPLGMTSSDAVLTDALRARAATGYGGDGKPVRYWRFQALAGAGAINSSAHDMVTYLRANMDVAGKRAKAAPLADAMAFAQAPKADMAGPGGPRIGLGWVIAPGGAALAHDGGTYGFSSYISFRADGTRGVVVLANSLQSQIVTSIGMHLMNPAFPLAVQQKAVTLPAALLDDYPGSYVGTPFGIAVTRAAGGLEVQLPGQPSYPVFASAPDAFFYKVVPAQISFDRDAGSRVVRAVIHQNGARFRMARVGADGKPLPQPARLSLDAAALQAYVGRYRLGPAATLIITLEGSQLMAQPPGAPSASPIFAETPDHFQFDVADVDLHFRRDAAGRVAGVRAVSGLNTAQGDRVEE